MPLVQSESLTSGGVANPQQPSYSPDSTQQQSSSNQKATPNWSCHMRESLFATLLAMLQKQAQYNFWPSNYNDSTPSLINNNLPKMKAKINIYHSKHFFFPNSPCCPSCHHHLHLLLCMWLTKGKPRCAWTAHPENSGTSSLPKHSMVQRLLAACSAGTPTLATASVAPGCRLRLWIS